MAHAQCNEQCARRGMKKYIAKPVEKGSGHRTAKDV